MTSTALLTDQYELTMISAALAAGTADRESVFEVFARRLPDGRRYGVVGFAVRYLGSYLLWRMRRKGHRGAYLRMPMEIEADWVARRQLATAVRDELSQRVAS